VKGESTAEGLKRLDVDVGVGVGCEESAEVEGGRG